MGILKPPTAALCRQQLYFLLCSTSSEGSFTIRCYRGHTRASAEYRQASWEQCGSWC